MPDDTAKPPPEPATCLAQRFDVPDFMVPKSIADVRELARMIALAEWAPASYRDIEGNYLQQKIELAIMHGATVGLGPIAAVQSIAVIDGMPTIWGDGALAIVERCGLLEDMVEDYQFDAEQGLTAICTMRRRRRPTPITNRFSMAMAEQARLTQKEGPWQSYPQRMLKMRARSWTIRDGFADVLRGLHIREEVDDFIETRGLSPALVNRVQDIRPAAPRPRRTPLEPKSPVEVPPAAMTVREASARPGADVGEEPDASQAEMLEPAQQESFTLADAEGGFIEVTGAEALRSEFERIFFDKHLAPGQILGLWESNDRARAAIERLFGAEALDPAAEHMRSAQAARQQPAEENDAGNDHPPEREPQEQEADRRSASPPDAPKPRPARAGRGTAKPAPATDHTLVVVIDPTWGDRKVFRHYRASLTAFRTNGSAKPPEIARFRAVNSATETRLRGLSCRS